MEAASTVVIKVKYGDMLRRFNALIVDEELGLSMDGLRGKILSLFSFAPDTELMLSYIDEDGDMVTLVDADDLRDVMKQGLNPIRITVKLSSGKTTRRFNSSSESSIPLKSPRVQPTLQNLQAGVSEILKTVPEPLRATLTKLSTDLTSKVSLSAPGITEFVDYFSKVGLSCLVQLSEFQTRAQPTTNNDALETRRALTETKDSMMSKIDAATLKVPSNGREGQSSKSGESLTKLQPEETMEHNKVKLINVTGGNMETSSSEVIGLKAVSSALGNVSVGKQEKVNKIKDRYLNEKSHLISSHSLVPPKKKLGKSSCTSVNLPSEGNNVPTEKEVHEPSEPHVGHKTADTSAPHPMKGDCLDGRMRCVFPGGLWASPGSIWGPPNSVSSNLPVLLSGSNPIYECSFSGTPIGNTSAAPLSHTSQAVPFRSSSSQNDSIGIVFHRGVRCDGCGVHPITGPRFKSKVKVDYDLCRICFSEIGNDTDYIRMERPVVRRHHMSEGFYDSNQAPMLPEVSKIKPCASKLDSCFIQDVNVFDGTTVAPLTPFIKIWRMRNNGMVVWPQKTQLIWIGGHRLSSHNSIELEIPAAGLPVDHELDIMVDFIAPELPGQYISYWRMISPSGQKFGQRVWVLIQVDASVRGTPYESIRSLNLNLPPVTNGLIGSETVNAEAEPIVKDSEPKRNNYKKMAEIVEPVLDLQPNNFQDMKFPINDSLLVGSGASSTVRFADPSVPCPVIHMLDPPLPPAPTTSANVDTLELPGKMAGNGASNSIPSPIIHMLDQSPPPAAAISSSEESAVELRAKKEVEEQLLKELEEMGFKHVALNREILRMNDYDLEQAVNDLCGGVDWDSILEDLWEMGFHDTEMNKMLLKKNKGSIMRVVMDLIIAGKI
ncbi:protein NBR1 homolog isoform X1 [Sesamum indicum]|uniref:Protein NBR1 homolog isoform X1 n=1 Tax=Sesamum indicum TaxID=4182 RepID=A0A6I9SP97_SESIN|nr:protein NBR1 homolog isoform X1 [Sesamum indicum]XP_011071949.1 protein NBR1 homolog isoform X1 [Sesamum indicum]XP_011071950.1 protein NBR1 homolog isoform X1 [Sesamum indicum]XP_011071951.1 protein NBR1 homolog isoform X1 [Sesamum indicum]XP_011071952.1 protein NBR1 homolog isoform X1 [Sesamum indicum]XP_020548687.1 protein NBR1 homolog isoform X1 [Sesamum indicum]